MRDPFRGGKTKRGPAGRRIRVVTFCIIHRRQDFRKRTAQKS
jgi:hypothetical protein